MAIVLRSVKGSNLVASEVDGNFTDLDDRVTALEDAPIAGVPPSNMTVAGTQWTIYYPDGLTFGPFTLPQGNFRPSIVGTLDVPTDGVYAVTSSADFNRFWNHDSGSDVTIDLPATATADMEVTFCQEGAGVVIFDGATDVVVKNIEGFLNRTGGPGSVVTAKFIEAGIWRLIGRVAEDVT